MKSRKTKWIRRLEGWPPTPPYTVHQILQERRRTNRLATYRARHVRAVERDGDDGFRCPDYHHIPLKPWEPVDPGNGWSCGCADDSPLAAGCVYR